MNEEVRGSGKSGPLLVCGDLIEQAHFVLFKLRYHRKAIINEQQLANACGTTWAIIRVWLDELRVEGFIARSDVYPEPYEKLLARACACDKWPGENPFSGLDLTGRTSVILNGGLGAPSDRPLITSASGSPAGGPVLPRPAPFRIERIDKPKAAKSKRTPRDPTKQVAYDLSKEFDRRLVEATGSRWDLDALGSKALYNEILRWVQRDGLTQQHGQLMIEEFFGALEAGVITKRKIPLWRMFIASKTRYYERAQMQIYEDGEAEEHEVEDDSRPQTVSRRPVVTMREHAERDRSAEVARRLRLGLPPDGPGPGAAR